MSKTDKHDTDPADAEVRQLADLRQHLVSQRMRVVNSIKGIIKHNLLHDAPTEDSSMQKFRQWIKTVQLPVVDCLITDMDIQTWELYDRQIAEVEAELAKRSKESNVKM